MRVPTPAAGSIAKTCITVGVYILYHHRVGTRTANPDLPLDTSLLSPGMRIAVGLSGGADSVALIRLLAARAGELGLVLHAAHLHHGLRGAEADRDQQFSFELAQSLNIPFHAYGVDTAAEAALRGESIEEAARRLRYSWFRELMAGHRLDAVATAHTLDDQAETVLGKFLRGAWTEGLSGISPVVSFPEGRLLRPLLAAKHSQIEAYLIGLGQSWCEDTSNLDSAFTRNRLRHQLLPELENWNPQMREHLAHLAELARGEEEYWQSEIARVAPQILFTGRPVRGGGRANTTDDSLAVDIVRLAALHVSIQRRLLRHAAGRFGVSLSFEATDSLRRMALDGRAGQKLALPGPLHVERTPRELRLSPGISSTGEADPPECLLPIPGEAVSFGWRFRASWPSQASAATVRNWRPGDRVTLRYSSGPRKVKEVLERLKVTGAARAEWPVIEWQGRVVWMQGVEVQPVPELTILAERV